jgi:hypothetical protein
MLIRSTSAIANANSDVVCSKVYNVIHDLNYHSLFSSLLAVSTFDIKNKNAALWVLGHPDTLSRLADTLLRVHCLEMAIEQQIEHST